MNSTCNELIQCPNCNDNPAEVLCIQCTRIHCMSCYALDHNGHNHTHLTQINEYKRCEIISTKDDLILNSTNINESIKLTESYNRLLDKNYNDTKAEMDRQWEIIYEEMMQRKMQISDALDELYRERVSQINKNLSILQELKIKNEYYISFISLMLSHNMNVNDVRLVKTIKDNQVTISIRKDTPELLSNVNLDFSMLNFMKSLIEICRVIKSVENVDSFSILDFTTITALEIPIENIQMENLQKQTVENQNKFDVNRKSFSQSFSLKPYKNTYTGEGPHKHYIFKKTFTQKGSTTHMVNTGKKPYICSIRNKSFSHKSSLKFHIVSHTCMKPKNS